MRDQSSKKDDNSFIMQRRVFISQQLQAEGKVRESTIQKWWETVRPDEEFSLKAVKNDILFIRGYERKYIFDKKIKDEVVWIDDSNKLGSTRELRLEHKYKEKSQIGELLICLVLGFNRIILQRESEGRRQKIDHLPKIENIINGYESGEDSPVMAKLRNYWKHGERGIFIDSGTTLHVFADDFIRHLDLPIGGYDETFADPSDERAVNKLEVITNDRHIFYCLGHPKVQAKTIIVGGRQQYGSSTISGMMAQNFLEANNLREGMGIIGTTKIGLNPPDDDFSYIFAENEHVAAIKHEFMERSDIKIVVADSDKFQWNTSRSNDVHVCRIKADEIDLVITDYATPEIIRHFKSIDVPLISYSSIRPDPEEI